MQTDVDVLLIGAGLAGIGVAHYLQTECPGKRYAILEARPRLGGTWDLFRYPGIRSDSPMSLYGYSFRPWRDDRHIAPGETILQYIEDTATEEGIADHIHFNIKARRASWSSKTNSWTVQAERTDTGEAVTFTCRWLQMCAGYYCHQSGHTPDFAGRDAFQGEVLHPQAWPKAFDPTGQRIVVIGSGATAVTLVPALAKTAAHVVMLQRSPTYVHAEPPKDRIALGLRRVLPDALAHNLTRKKDLYLEYIRYTVARNRPDKAKQILKKQAKKRLPRGFDVDRHFTPPYEPWDQRVCLSLDGDLFSAIKRGTASVVTDTIDTFTSSGIRVQSGQELSADTIVMATGLKMLIWGGMEIEVDGRVVDSKDPFIYKGVMLSSVPNMMITAGSLIASYTLRVELIARYLCRVLEHMDNTQTQRAVPVPDPNMGKQPFVTGFNSGYLLRAIDRFPKQGTTEPWLNVQTYLDNRRVLEAPVADGVLEFTA